MVLSGQKFDLHQMKEYFEKQIPHIRLLSDMMLSESDYKSLGAKLKAAFSFSNRKEGIEDTMICYLVYWVYDLIYGDTEAGIPGEQTEFFTGLSQYQIRHYLQMLLDTFANYGIDDFGYKIGSVEERCIMLVARHAGIPDEEKYAVFALVEPYRQQNVSVDTMVEEIYESLPHRSHFILSLLDPVSRQEMIWEIRMLLDEADSQSYTREELLKRHPDTAVSLIDSCLYWQEEKAVINQAK